MSADDRAEVISLFIKALSHLPRWAVAKGFDAWEKAGHRRPSPGEIVILAERAVKEIAVELAARAEIERRKNLQPEPPPEPLAPEAKAEAERILQYAGFTPKLMQYLKAAPMARSMADAVEAAQKPNMQHWTEWANDRDRAALAEARNRNPLVQDARADQARRAAE